LEEAFLREDVDGAIQDSVAAYVEAASAGDELLQALWAGQVRAHLNRFTDLRTKWISHSVVQEIVEAAQKEGVAA
jgi:preprotein translocase subunit SecA